MPGSKEKLPLSMSKTNCVTIYVWKPNKTNRPVGHAAMRTYAGGPNGEGNYISFWPSQLKENPEHNKPISFWSSSRKNIPSHAIKPWDKRNKLFGYLRDSEREKTIKQMFETDCSKDYENGLPEVTIDLYSLNTQIINDEYEKFRKSGCKWSIWGSAFFRTEDMQNCCGLVFFLLAKAGLKQLVDYHDKHLAKILGATGAGFGLLILRIALSFASNSIDIDDFSIVSQAVGGALWLAGIGGLSGKVTGEMLDTYLGVRRIITPNGIAKLVQMAKENEVKKYEALPMNIEDPEFKYGQLNLRSRL